MIFGETKIKGAYVVDVECVHDERGFFGRTFCEQELTALHLEFRIVQCNISYNRKQGTVRGMHYQRAPFEEIKWIQCLRGAIYDVIVDLRPESDTYLQWCAVELNEDNRRILYVPKGVAHGFQTLKNDSEVFYQMSQCYHPHASAGIRWNDPVLQIKWPLPCEVISDRDRSYPELGERS